MSTEEKESKKYIGFFEKQPKGKCINRTLTIDEKSITAKFQKIASGSFLVSCDSESNFKLIHDHLHKKYNNISTLHIRKTSTSVGLTKDFLKDLEELDLDSSNSSCVVM